MKFNIHGDANVVNFWVINNTETGNATVCKIAFKLPGNYKFI